MTMKPSLLALALAALAGLNSSAADWKLVWSDEFDRPGAPDAAKWDYETGWVRNHEAQFYTRARPENARVENGCLVIEARQERFPNPAYDPQSKNPDLQREYAEITSASVITRGKASWRAGRVEVRAKLPAGRGVWPAIWMLGENIGQAGWPACGEIDIMEFVGHEPGVVHANIHTRKYNHTQNNGKGSKLSLPGASAAFHVYAVEWNHERMEFSVDGKKYFTYENEGSGKDAWPYDEPQYLILNLAIGGAWGGAQGIDDGIFPQKFLIDYVRVYQRQNAP